jgi:membrane protein implicated in regulation of membrane protease activity
VWLALGLVLLLVELVTPSGFFIMFFGLGAITVGILAGAGVSGPAWSQWLIFLVSAVFYLLLFRGRLRGNLQHSGAEVDTLVGEAVTSQERILPGELGRVELRGTVWNARNNATVAIEAGRRCRVVGVDGLVVFIQPE